MEWKLWIKLALATVVLEGGVTLISLYASYTPQSPLEIFMTVNGVLCLAAGLIYGTVVLVEEYS